MASLVYLEHEAGELKSASLPAITMAAEIDANQVTGLVMGYGIEGVAEQASRFLPVIALDHASLSRLTADSGAEAIRRVVVVGHYDTLVAVSNSASKDIVARAAGLLGGAMASDVVAHKLSPSGLHLVRPMFAGSVLATVELLATPRVITIRSTAYAGASPAGSFPITRNPIALDDLPHRIELIGRSSRQSHRPDVAEASVVVSGGRAFATADDFERIVGGLADVLHGATGSSRALVDAGITPNDFQVGQTGKIVAPDLYFALGISGAVQHLAGMKNSKVIVAINSDPHASIFDVADFGWVADVYEAVPQVIEELTRSMP